MYKQGQFGFMNGQEGSFNAFTTDEMCLIYNGLILQEGQTIEVMGKLTVSERELNRKMLRMIRSALNKIKKTLDAHGIDTSIFYY